jgi:NADH-quinone oxidoreductase subunit A
VLPLILAQVAPSDAGDSPSAWIPVVLLIVIGILFAIGNIAASLIIGPSRTGPAKETTYESGMVPVGDTRRRFNVRFYIVAMIFLVIDVDIIFFYPWASIFAPVIQKGTPQQGTMVLIEMILFVAILMVAYLYAWGKGVFRWD